MVVADVPAQSLTDDCPTYSLAASEPAYIQEVQSADLSHLPEPEDYNAVLLKLLASPSIASKRWVYDQYDSMVQTQTTVLPGAADAAVLRLRESGPLTPNPGGTGEESSALSPPELGAGGRFSKGIALTTDCNPRYCYLDPYVGAQIAVAEAARNLSCVGATPLAVTDCLNFASPEKPEGFWQFRRAVEGLADACEAFGTPVISGNVSFYNETPEQAIYPTPTVGMIGLLPDADKRVTMGFKKNDDMIWFINFAQPSFGGSEYLSALYEREVGTPPALDMEAEKRVQAFIRKAIEIGFVQSAHDVSDGGLAVALAECCIASNVGANVTVFHGDGSDALALFGEQTAGIIFSVSEEDNNKFHQWVKGQKLPADCRLTAMGEVWSIGEDCDSPQLQIESKTSSGYLVNISVGDLRAAYEGAIPAAMGSTI